jgi:hypothetical protein
MTCLRSVAGFRSSTLLHLALLLQWEKIAQISCPILYNRSPQCSRKGYQSPLQIPLGKLLCLAEHLRSRRFRVILSFSHLILLSCRWIFLWGFICLRVLSNKYVMSLHLELKSVTSLSSEASVNHFFCKDVWRCLHQVLLITKQGFPLLHPFHFLPHMDVS